MSILNVLLQKERLVVAVDTVAEDAHTGQLSEGAKILVIPQHRAVLACRGSAQFFIKVYELCLQASFRAGFTLEQLMSELGPVIDKIWPAYLEGAARAGIAGGGLSSEIVLGGWSPKAGRMLATAYAKNSEDGPTIVQGLEGGLASPGEPLRGRHDSFEPDALLEAGRRQAEYLNLREGRLVAGGRLIAGLVEQKSITLLDLGAL